MKKLYVGRGAVSERCQSGVRLPRWQVETSKLSRPRDIISPRISFPILLFQLFSKLFKHCKRLTARIHMDTNPRNPKTLKRHWHCCKHWRNKEMITKTRFFDAATYLKTDEDIKFYSSRRR